MKTAIDAWIDALPDDMYNPCPCGCGKKLKFVIRDGEIEKHEKKFIEDYNKNKERSD